MARGLTKKQRGFVKDYVKTGNGTQSAYKNFEVINDNSAASRASQVLRNVKVQEELDRLGFNEKSAKSVVVEIMKDTEADANARLKATDQIFKVEGSYAPEKSINVHIDIKPNDKLKQLAETLNAD